MEMGKINKCAAHMLLAKLYLNHNAWFKDDTDKSWYQSSLDEVNKVLEGPFSLAANYNENSVRISLIHQKLSLVFLWRESMAWWKRHMANLWIHNAGRARLELCWLGQLAGGIVFPQFLDIYEEGDTRFENTWTGGQQYAQDGSPITVDGEPLGIYQGTS